MNDFLRAEIQEFSKAQGWNLDISYAAGFQGTGDLLSALAAAVQAGNPPDAFFQDIATRQYQFQGVLDDTDALTKEMIQAHGETYPAMIENANIDGKWYGVPFYGRTGGYFVREDWFQEAGLDPVKDIDTYDKLRTTALKLSNPANKRWGFGMTINRSGDGSSDVQVPMLRFGSTVQDKTGQLVTFNSPETIACFTWLKETYSDPKWAAMLPPGINSWTDTSNNEAMLAGTIAITDNAGTVYAKAQFDKVPHKDKILFVNRPKRTSDGLYLDSIGGSRLHVVKGSKNKDASADLIRHLVSDPVQKVLYAVSPGYVVPPYKNAWNDPLVQADRNAKAAFALAYPTPFFGGAREPGPPSKAVDAIWGGTFHTDAMAEILQGKAIADVVKDYHNKMVQVFKDFGYKGA